MSDAPKLLVFCDFPPSHRGGGPILLRRLLADHPPDRLELVVGSRAAAEATVGGLVPARQITLPVSNGTGRLGLGRLKTALDWSLLPLHAMVGAAVAAARRAEVVLTVAHGHLFLAAAMAAKLTRRPLIVIVHDDWAGHLEEHGLVLGRVARRLFGVALRGADVVYAVSPAMQALLHDRDHVAAELQMPGTELLPVDTRDDDPSILRIAFAGTLHGAVADALALLVDVVRSDALSRRGVPDWRLSLYTPPDPALDALIAGTPHIEWGGWLAQADLGRALGQATVLFLPFSFEPNQAYATHVAFPSKTADYLATGRPLLVLGPPQSSVVRYAREEGFAEIVDALDANALADALGRLWRSPERRAELRAGAAKTFARNHDVRAQRQQFAATVARLARR